jgi:hypothetical protein
MQHDAHVRDYRAPRTVFKYEFADGGSVELVASRGLCGAQMVWAAQVLIDNQRRAMRREWEEK